MLVSEGLTQRKCCVGESMQASEGRGRAGVKKSIGNFLSRRVNDRLCPKWAEEKLTARQAGPQRGPTFRGRNVTQYILLVRAIDYYLRGNFSKKIYIYVCIHVYDCISIIYVYACV